MFKVNDKDLQFLEQKLARRGSILFCTLLEIVTQWDSTLHSELEVSCSNPTVGLGQALGPNLITRLLVNFELYLK